MAPPNLRISFWFSRHPYHLLNEFTRHAATGQGKMQRGFGATTESRNRLAQSPLLELDSSPVNRRCNLQPIMTDSSKDNRIG